MGYDGLLALLKAAAEERRAEAPQPPVACPVCGWAPLDERDGILNCPAGDWTSTTGST